MIQRLLFTERELQLYSPVMSYLVSGIRPLILVFSVIFVAVLWLLGGDADSRWLVFSVLVASLGSVLLLMHLQRVINQQIWLEKNKSTQAGLIVLGYTFVVFALWNVALLYGYYIHSPIASLLNVVAILSALLSMSVSASFGRLFFVLIFIVIALRNLMVVLFFPDLFAANLNLTASDIVIFLFSYVFNKKTLDSLELQVVNEKLLQNTEESNLKLQQMTRNHSHYLSAASHDLRQPLHALGLILNDITNKNSDHVLHPTLGNMNIALDHLVSSFESMQRLSQLDSGLVKPRIDRFSIAQLFEKITQEYADLARAKGLSWRVYHSKWSIESDEQLLLQVLGHMVGNAIAKTDRGGILLGVRLVRRKDNHTFAVRLSVYDTGIGLSEGQLERLINPTHSWHQFQQREIGGVGLGFAIANRLSKLLGGKIKVRSQQDAGSCFGLLLPCPVRFNPDDSALNAPAEPMMLSHTDTIANKRIVILDDNEMVAEELEVLLNSWGAQVSVALSTEMLTELYDEEGAFDLIISDYHLGLPDETGLDCILALMALQGRATVQGILISGDTSVDLELMAQKHAIHLLHKPIRPARFRAFLQRILASAPNSVN